MAVTRQGRVRVQAAHSAARTRRQAAWAEPPGRPTLARTPIATTGRSAWVPASSSSGSSSKGQDRGLAISGAPSWWPWPAMLLVRPRLAGALAGGQAFVGAVGGALLGVDPVALDRAELLL
jgi:hypothetical protein